MVGFSGRSKDHHNRTLKFTFQSFRRLWRLHFEKARLSAAIFLFFAISVSARFYASLPLLKFWPDIDKQVLREFAATVPKEWPEKGLLVWKTQLTGTPVLHKRKKIGAVPHDLGVPCG